MTGKIKKMSKKIKIYVSLCAVAIMILSFFCGFFTYKLIRGKTLDTLDWVVRYVEDLYYYDEGDGKIKNFTADEYAAALVKGLLDDYSRYYSKDEYADVVATSKGNNYGSGINIENVDNPQLATAEIYSVAGNSPAYFAGVLAGDVVTSAKEKDADSVEITNRDQLSKFIKNCDQEFSITVKRGENEQLTFNLKKRVFVKSFVFYDDSQNSLRFENEGEGALEKRIIPNANALSLDDKTAVITLTNFNGDASEQFAEAMEYMKEQGRTKLVLDLRKNGGGYMNVLSDIASHLIYADEGKTLVALAKYKNGSVEKFHATANKYNDEIEKIVAVADDDTASASECLLGAMLYYRRAFSLDNLVIEGSDSPAHTYGKGIMQTTYVNVLEGSALKLTTAVVYQPDGATTIHGKGIQATTENSVAYGEGLSRALQLIA